MLAFSTLYLTIGDLKRWLKRKQAKLALFLSKFQDPSSSRQKNKVSTGIFVNFWKLSLEKLTFKNSEKGSKTFSIK